MSKTPVLLADSHILVREVFCRMINALEDFEVVAEAADGHTAIHLTRQLKPKIVLLDVHIPGLNGLKATAQIRQESPDTLIVILSLHTEKNYTLEALHVGAMGYVNRFAFADELEKILCAVMKGEHWFNSVATHQFLQKNSVPTPIHLNHRMETAFHSVIH